MAGHGYKNETGEKTCPNLRNPALHATITMVRGLVSALDRIVFSPIHITNEAAEKTCPNLRSPAPHATITKAVPKAKQGYRESF